MFSIFSKLDDAKAVLNDMVMTHDEAYNVLNDMSADGLKLNTVGYNCLLSALCKEHRIPEAINIFREMPRKGCKPDVYTFNSMISGLCEVDNIEQALWLHRDMISEGVVANTVQRVTQKRRNQRSSTGEVDKARSLFEKMLKDGIVPSIISCNILIELGPFC
ncbi:unnamed protein product [Cochlearia groenlandica]